MIHREKIGNSRSWHGGHLSPAPDSPETSEPLYFLSFFSVLRSWQYVDLLQIMFDMQHRQSHEVTWLWMSWCWFPSSSSSHLSLYLFCAHHWSLASRCSRRSLSWFSNFSSLLLNSSPFLMSSSSWFGTSSERSLNFSSHSSSSRWWILFLSSRFSLKFYKRFLCSLSCATLISSNTLTWAKSILFSSVSAFTFPTCACTSSHYTLSENKNTVCAIILLQQI